VWWFVRVRGAELLRGCCAEAGCQRFSPGARPTGTAAADRLLEYIASVRNGGEVERRMGIDHHTFVRRLAKVMTSARRAAAQFYSDGAVEPPEQYAQDLADVEVQPEPVRVDELVLSTYRELKSLRKTAQACGVGVKVVRRIIDNREEAA
jgi:hypothetical protein